MKQIKITLTIDIPDDIHAQVTAQPALFDNPLERRPAPTHDYVEKEEPKQLSEKQLKTLLINGISREQALMMPYDEACSLVGKLIADYHKRKDEEERRKTQSPPPPVYKPYVNDEPLPWEKVKNKRGRPRKVYA